MELAPSLSPDGDLRPLPTDSGDHHDHNYDDHGPADHIDNIHEHVNYDVDDLDQHVDDLHDVDDLDQHVDDDSAELVHHLDELLHDVDQHVEQHLHVDDAAPRWPLTRDEVGRR